MADTPQPSLDYFLCLVENERSDIVSSSMIIPLQLFSYHFMSVSEEEIEKKKIMFMISFICK